MEKLKNVGAGPVSAKKEVIDDCPEFSKRNKPKAHGMQNLHSNFKGITLIALIITIIVMLILVGVTITVALNGGLFESAKQGTTETEKHAILEEIIAMAKWNTSGELEVEELISNVKSKYPEASYTEPKLEVPGKYEKYEYRVSKEEIEIYKEKTDSSNIWEQRGLKSDIVYDRLYSTAGETEYEQKLNVKSNGGIYIELKSSESFDFTSEEVDDWINDGIFIIGEKTIKIDNGDSSYLIFNIEDANTIRIDSNNDANGRVLN